MSPFAAVLFSGCLRFVRSLVPSWVWLSFLVFGMRCLGGSFPSFFGRIRFTRLGLLPSCLRPISAFVFLRVFGRVVVLLILLSLCRASGGERSFLVVVFPLCAVWLGFLCCPGFCLGWGFSVCYGFFLFLLSPGAFLSLTVVCGFLAFFRLCVCVLVCAS